MINYPLLPEKRVKKSSLDTGALIRQKSLSVRESFSPCNSGIRQTIFKFFEICTPSFKYTHIRQRWKVRLLKELIMNLLIFINISADAL